ncbi:MAG: M15 family metallopeptidase [Pseudomonadota bacterium]
MDNRIIPILLGVMALIVVGLGVFAYFEFRTPRVPVYASDSNADFNTSAVDSGARIEIENLRAQIEALAEQIETLEKEIRRVDQAAQSRAPVQQSGPGQAPVFDNGNNDIIDSYAQVVLIAQRRELNKGLRIASPSYLEGVFGKPRANLTSQCQGMTNERLRSKLFTEQVGPIRVRMLRPALDSLGRVFAKIEEVDPDLYTRINTAGALCVRHIRGAPGRTSTHAFGLSVDLNIDGQLDRLGDGRTQLGLTILADFFREEGWYWGAGFSREDSMHFEVSRDLVEKWISEGKL